MSLRITGKKLITTAKVFITLIWQWDQKENSLEMKVERTVVLKSATVATFKFSWMATCWNWMALDDGCENHSEKSKTTT